MPKGQFYASGNGKLQLTSRERTNVNTFSNTPSVLSQTWVCRSLELILYIKKPLYFLAYVFFS